MPSAKELLEETKEPEVTGMNRVVDFIAQRLNPEWFATSGRTLLETAQGTKTPITEKNFKPEELDVIRQLVDVKGKDKGSISYADYIQLARKIAKEKGEPLPSSVTPSLFSMADPLGNIQTTLGRFTYQTDPKGNLQIIDRYDFNPPMQQDMREARTGDYGAFGPYGMIREYAGEKIPPGKGRDVRINLGPRKRFEDGGEVIVPRGTSEVPQLDPEDRLIDEREDIRSESQRMLNRLQSQPSKVPPGIRRVMAASRAQGKELDAFKGDIPSPEYRELERRAGMQVHPDIPYTYREMIGIFRDPEAYLPESFGENLERVNLLRQLYGEEGFARGGEVIVPRETSTSKKQLDTLAQISQRKKA